MKINKEDSIINKELENTKWDDFDASQEVKVVPALKWSEHLILLKLDPEMLK